MSRFLNIKQLMGVFLNIIGEKPVFLNISGARYVVPLVPAPTDGSCHDAYQSGIEAAGRALASLAGR